MRKPSLRISFNPPALRTDGSALSPEDINKLWYRLYIDDEMVLDDIGRLEFEYLMEGEPEGVKEVQMTAVLYGLESPRSEVIPVNFIAPAAPRNIIVGFDWYEETSVSGSVG